MVSGFAVAEEVFDRKFEVMPEEWDLKQKGEPNAGDLWHRVLPSHFMHLLDASARINLWVGELCRSHCRIWFWFCRY